MKALRLHNIHFIEIHKAFTNRKADEGKSVSHIESVGNLSKEFLFFLESNQVLNINQITQNIVNKYFDYLERRKNQRKSGGLANSYLAKHREAVLRFIEFVMRVDIGKSSIYIQKYATELAPKDILTEDEISQLFQATTVDMDGIRTKAMLSLLYGCGLRKGELHQLNVQDIDMTKNCIRLLQTKTAYQRDVPFTSEIKNNLEEYLYSVRELLLSEDGLENAFLLSNQGTRMSLPGIQYKIKALGRKSGITKPITAHRLRHTIATHLLGDFSIEEIATFLGHRCLDSSQIYTHIKHTKTLPNL